MLRSSFSSAGILLLLAASYFSVRATPIQNSNATRTTSTKPAQSSAAAPAVAPRAVLDTYCVTCHNERLKTGGIVLEKVDVDHPDANPEVWEKVLRKLRSGEMPPPGRPRP